jgi:hypothetical protein
MTRVVSPSIRLLLGLSAIALLLASCGGGDDDTSPTATTAPAATSATSAVESPAPALTIRPGGAIPFDGTPTPTATTEPAPTSDAAGQGSAEGWHDFTDGPYSGAIRDEWAEVFVDSESTKTLADAGLKAQGDVSDAQRQAALQMLEGAANNTLFVLLKADNPTFVSNINIIGCFTASDVPPRGHEVEAIQASGIEAYDKGNVSFEGESYPLTMLRLYQPLDTYQVYPSHGDCYSVITLTVPKDETTMAGSSWVLPPQRPAEFVRNVRTASWLRDAYEGSFACEFFSRVLVLSRRPRFSLVPRQRALLTAMSASR